MIKGVRVVIATLLLGMPAMAAAEDDIVKQMIANPNPFSLNIYGPQDNSRIKDDAVQGGNAVHVELSKPSANPWDAAAIAPITGAIHAGDKIVCAVWLKADDADNGGAVQLSLHIQLAAEPYTQFADKSLTLTKDWKLYPFVWVAGEDHPENSVGLSLMLAYGKQSLDIGPVFVLDRGPASATP